MFFVIASMLSLGIGAYILSIMATNEIKRYLNSVNECAISKENPSKSFERLAEFINFDSEVKQ